MTARPDAIICPNCCCQFIAIPEDTQAELRQLREYAGQCCDALREAIQCVPVTTLVGPAAKAHDRWMDVLEKGAALSKNTTDDGRCKCNGPNCGECRARNGVGSAGLVLVCPDRDGQCPTPRDCGERGCTYTGEPV